MQIQKKNDIISQVKDQCNKYSDCANSYVLSIEDSNNLREIKGWVIIANS